jgi:hypothetical protein
MHFFSNATNTKAEDLLFGQLTFGAIFASLLF